MPPKVKPGTQSAANRGVSAARGGRGARGGRSGGRGGRPTTATASQVNQEEGSMPSAEVEAMKAELEMLRKSNNPQAKKAAEAKRRIGEYFLYFCENININYIPLQSPGRELQIDCLRRWRKRKTIPLPSALEQTHFCRTMTLIKMNKLWPETYHLFPPPGLEAILYCLMMTARKEKVSQYCYVVDASWETLLIYRC
jgi:hypothetical protein